MPDIVAKLKKVIWRSLENDFTIAAFELENKLSKEFIATGDLFKPATGITYSMSGKWEEHHKYGKQFKIDSYCVQAPCDIESILIYLEKHVTGVGPVLADKLIEKYGKHTIRILKKAPERVCNENKRISYKKALAISNQLSEGDKRQDILIQLEGMFAKVKGLPKRLAQDALNVYGLTAYEVVKNNPYQLIEMNRIGFLLADKVALACGIAVDDQERIKHGILYVIRQLLNDSGNVWLHPSMILQGLAKLIDGLDGTMALMKLIDDGVLVVMDKHVTFASLDEDESCIADCVTNFLS